ncbi:MAG: rRNA maturation RNase YbeY [Clostridia bacterium]|nr:rRNA maturation RNase YbeY [Clostridia bacterium]MDD4375697.1 rRNA maturation RNase YbeY [Clostridia bacterium]
MKINIDYYLDVEEEIHIKEYNKFIQEYSEKIEKIVKYALETNGIITKKIYIGIGVVIKEKIKEINYEHRGINKETDVLSFPMFKNKEIEELKSKASKKTENEILLGDIILCPDVIKEQAEEYGTGFNREMLYMITHGVCHLLGYDHEETNDKKDMRKMEEEILKVVGV